VRWRPALQRVHWYFVPCSKRQGPMEVRRPGSRQSSGGRVTRGLPVLASALESFLTMAQDGASTFPAVSFLSPIPRPPARLWTLCSLLRVTPGVAAASRLLQDPFTYGCSAQLTCAPGDALTRPLVVLGCGSDATGLREFDLHYTLLRTTCTSPHLPRAATLYCAVSCAQHHCSCCGTVDTIILLRTPQPAPARPAARHTTILADLSGREKRRRCRKPFSSNNGRWCNRTVAIRNKPKTNQKGQTSANHASPAQQAVAPTWSQRPVITSLEHTSPSSLDRRTGRWPIAARHA